MRIGAVIYTYCHRFGASGAIGAPAIHGVLRKPLLGVRPFMGYYVTTNTEPFDGQTIPLP